MLISRRVKGRIIFTNLVFDIPERWYVMVEAGHCAQFDGNVHATPVDVRVISACGPPHLDIGTMCTLRLVLLSPR